MKKIKYLILIFFSLLILYPKVLMAHSHLISEKKCYVIHLSSDKIIEMKALSHKAGYICPSGMFNKERKFYIHLVLYGDNKSDVIFEGLTKAYYIKESCRNEK